jgi:hypothetical protein
MALIQTSKPRHAMQLGMGKIVTIVSAAVAAIVLAACHFVGSGTMHSAARVGSATFTFDLNCPTNGTATGVINYLDTPAGVLIRGLVPGTTKPYSCSSTTTSTTVTADGAAKPAITPLPFGAGTFSGSYTPLKGGTGGTFTVTVVTGGTNSTSSPGWVCIALYGGVYDGYTNAGTVTWGNIVGVNS